MLVVFSRHGLRRWARRARRGLERRGDVAQSRKPALLLGARSAAQHLAAHTDAVGPNDIIIIKQLIILIIIIIIKQ